MAKYIKLRLAAAKVGVSMALMALIAGLADRTGVAAAKTNARSVVGENLLSEISIPTGGGLDRIVIQKLDSALATLEHKLARNYFTAQKIDSTFLKIKSANTEFLKIKSANTDFLKIDDANANFLKIDDASRTFLKIDGIAGNSSELGGLPASDFGTVASGAVTASGSSPRQTLLTAPGTNGAIIVVCTPVPGGGLSVSVENATGITIPAVQDQDGASPTAISLAPGSTPITALAGGPTQLHLQTFPTAGFEQVLTLTISSESPAAGQFDVVGQMLNGDG